MVVNAIRWGSFNMVERHHGVDLEQLERLWKTEAIHGTMTL